MPEDPLSDISRTEDDVLYNVMYSVKDRVGKYSKKKFGTDISGRVWAGVSLPRYLHHICWTLNNLDMVAEGDEAARRYEEVTEKLFAGLESGDTSTLTEAAEMGVELCKETHSSIASGSVAAIPVAAALDAISMMIAYRGLEQHEEFNDPDILLKWVRYYAELDMELASDVIRAVHGHRMRRFINRDVDPATDGVKRLADGIKAAKLNSSTIMVEVGDDGTVLTIQGVGPEFDEILRKDHYDLIEKKKETVRAAKEALKELESIL